MRTLFLALALAAAPARATPADESAIREFKTVLWPRAYAQGDVALLDRLLADSFQSIDGAGDVSTKAAELAWLRTKRPDPPGYSFRFQIERLEIVGGDMAIVAGTGHVARPEAGGVRRFTYRSSNILVKQGGAWRAIASHISGQKAVPPA